MNDMDKQKVTDLKKKRQPSGTVPYTVSTLYHVQLSHLNSQLQVLLLTSDELVCVVAVHDVLVVSAKKKKCRVWYHCHCKLKKCIVSLLVDMHGIFNNYALFFFQF